MVYFSTIEIGGRSFAAFLVVRFQLRSTGVQECSTAQSPCALLRKCKVVVFVRLKRQVKSALSKNSKLVLIGALRSKSASHQRRGIHRASCLLRECIVASSAACYGFFTLPLSDALVSVVFVWLKIAVTRQSVAVYYAVEHRQFSCQTWPE